jgi:hypothetical protein
MFNPLDASATLVFLDLAIQELSADLPAAHAGMRLLNPLSEVTGQGVEVQRQPIAGEDEHAARGQDVFERMNQGMCHLLSPQANVQRRNQLAPRICGDPHPHDLTTLANGCAYFIKLHVSQMQSAQQSVMQRLRVHPAPRQPGLDRELAVPKDARGYRHTHSLGQRRHHHRDPRRGRLQPIQRVPYRTDTLRPHA